ncbi:hypothetical protein ACW6QP_08125 [Salegentibacter sp. HM20]
MTNLKLTPSSSVLLIESSSDEANTFVEVVKKKFGITRVKIFANSFEAIKHLQQHLPDLVVVEEAAKPMNAAQTTDYIKKELKLELPVYTSLARGNLEVQNFTIEKPFSSASIDKLGDFLEEKAPKPLEPLYSLDYLYDLSDGNMDFVYESLKIFKTSVKAQLTELEMACKDNDHQKAGKIAHNIKPSFEMIENQEGAEICNKLTYELEDNSLSELVSRLQELFDKIIVHLDTDLAPNNI